VAEAALDVLVDEKLMQRAADLGAHMAKRLHAIDSPRIKEVRCVGLWAGIELQGDAGGARKYSEALQAEGYLVKETHVHTLRLAPPLVITKDELDDALDAVERVLKA
jgi:ornithine--oxo-acid transaminase